MGIRLLHDDALQYVLLAVVESLLADIETHSVTEYLFALLSRDQYRRLAHTVLLTRRATVNWLSPTPCFSQLSRLELKTKQLGPDVLAAVALVATPAKILDNEEAVTRTVRRVLATANTLGETTNWAQLSPTNGRALASMAIYSQPALVRMQRAGVNRTQDSSLFAPLHRSSSIAWFRPKLLPVEYFPEEAGAEGLTIHELFYRIATRWDVYFAPTPIKPVNCDVVGCCHQRGKCTLAPSTCTINTTRA